MLFNSIDFAIFLPIIFILYWFVTNKNLKLQNLLIVISSYIFYSWWDWRFLSLILFSTIVDYLIGISLSKQENQTKRKMLLWTSIFVNIGFLGFFKYYNFFLDNFITAFSFFGAEIKANSLNIILPVGISFYTFQTLSYTIDVYKQKLEATKDFIVFSAFVSFFPQLVAGPIERATNLLPQFYTKRHFDYSKSVDGMRQILWGLFKKTVIADNCAHYANIIFNNSSEYSGSTLVLGAIFFTFQIYCDFSGYSDIAIGVSRLFGFNLKQNFAFPYFSRDVAEFWRRWHISLSTWFRDYLYIPLGGSHGGTWNKIRNVFIIFLVSGFWHGANWTFIFWGALNALFFLPIFITNNNRNNLNVVAQGKYLPNVKEFLSIVLTFSLTVFAWIFFRAENINHAFRYISEIFSSSLFKIPEIQPITIFLLLIFFIIIEWNGREKQYAISNVFLNCHKLIKWGFYAFIITLIGIFMKTEVTPFIYFQF
ncbi:membrane-bound O-acyltransferase family protein [Seonamhaeicola sp. S2-3]|uniref:MBOAT family O-acyltransferase n=1 Tax=Seonamhaeicola sp. S2-3 TaxID=1936081 RepID=UPI0009729243|nr:MBOAT family O-acyltransferase [Seonamhaeicola sp. S2-3]APY11356.1 membrane-bound O-acyltransferase family protein [Seonamhaeicola sp. S2-3]